MTFLLRNSQFSQKKVFNLHTIKINNVSQWILTHYNFRLRARSPYRCHVLMSLLWGHNVG